MDDDLSTQMKALLAPPAFLGGDILQPVSAGLRAARRRRRVAAIAAAAAITLAAGAVLSVGYGLAARALPPPDGEAWPFWLPLIACGALVLVVLRELLQAVVRS